MKRDPKLTPVHEPFCLNMRRALGIMEEK